MTSAVAGCKQSPHEDAQECICTQSPPCSRRRLSHPTFAEEAKASDAAASPQMSDAEMMAKMTELSKLNENHKLLAQLAGTWTYTVKNVDGA